MYLNLHYLPPLPAYARLQPHRGNLISPSLSLMAASFLFLPPPDSLLLRRRSRAPPPLPLLPLPPPSLHLVLPKPSNRSNIFYSSPAAASSAPSPTVTEEDSSSSSPPEEAAVAPPPTDEPSTADADSSPVAAEFRPNFGGCKTCGQKEIEKGCNGEGRIQGGIATVPGFGWWPIKAYRPCPAFVASGGRYRRQGQSMDEVAFGRGRRVPVESSNKGKTSKKREEPRRSKG